MGVRAGTTTPLIEGDITQGDGKKTVNMLLMGREARLPPNIHHPVEMSEYTTDEHIVQLKERLDAVREKLQRM